MKLKIFYMIESYTRAALFRNNKTITIFRVVMEMVMVGNGL